MRGWRRGLVIAAALASGCTLLTSLDGLEGGGPTASSSGEAGTDASAPGDGAALDGGAVDAGTPPAAICEPGRCVATTLVGGQNGPYKLAAGSDRLAWFTCGDNLHTIAKSGGPSELVAGLSGVNGLAVHQDRLYVATGNAILAGSVGPAKGAPLPLVGVGARTILADTRGVFFTKEGEAAVYQCGLDACSQPEKLASLPIDSLGLVLQDARAVYGARLDKFATLWRIDPDARAAEKIADGVDNSMAWGQTDDAIYWSDCADGCALDAGPSALRRIAKNQIGGAIAIAQRFGEGPITGIATIGDLVYFITEGTNAKRHLDGALYRTRKDGAELVKVLGDLVYPAVLLASNGQLFWISYGPTDGVGNFCDWNTDGAVLRLDAR